MSGTHTRWHHEVSCQHLSRTVRWSICSVRAPSVWLSAGLLASPCLLQVDKGTVYVPVVNVGTTDALLYPRTSLGALTRADVVSLPAGVTAVNAISATASLQLAAGPLQDRLEEVDLSALDEEEQTEVRALLQSVCGT